MNFRMYYAHYLGLHQNRWCRRLHVLGQIATVSFVLAVLRTATTTSAQALWLLVFTPFVVYPFAWSGHFFFEKNTPAAWQNPIWAKAADWVMLWQIITGKIPF